MSKRVFIAGHGGMVGSALVRQLRKNNSIITANRADLDLCNQQQVTDFFSQNAIDEVYLSAAKVGGIHANDTYVDDMARASIHIMNLPLEVYQEVTEPRLSHINVGSGVDCSIAELVGLIAEVTGFEGHINYDTSKPDGPPRKLMDSSKLKSLGWQPQFQLKEGLANAYRWFVENYAKLSKQG